MTSSRDSLSHYFKNLYYTANELLFYICGGDSPGDFISRHIIFSNLHISFVGCMRATTHHSFYSPEIYLFSNDSWSYSTSQIRSWRGLVISPNLQCVQSPMHFIFPAVQFICAIWIRRTSFDYQIFGHRRPWQCARRAS